MYCPNCELEIKGEEKSQCPICNGPLVDGPFETPTTSDDMSDTELKLKELIRDIDEKVSKNLEESGIEQEFQLENFKLDTAEPSAKEFELALDSSKPGNLSESTEDQIFNLSEDSPEAAKNPKEPVFDFADMETSVDQKDLQEASATFTEAVTDMHDTAAPELTTSEKTPRVEIDDTVEIARFNVKPPKEEVSTKAILDQALDELETEKNQTVKTKKKSFAMPVLVGSFLLAVVIAAGMYVLNFKSEPVTVSPVKSPTKESPVLKKTVPDSTSHQSQQTPEAQKTVTTSDNKTETVAQVSSPAPALPAPEKPGTAQQPAPSDKQPTVMQEPGAQQPAGQKEEALIQAPEQPKTAASPKDSGSVKEELPGERPPAEQESVAAKEPAQQKEAFRATAGTFTVHAGSYRTEKTASQEARRLKQRGFDAYSEKADLGAKGTWYRIKIGSFGSRAEAEKVLQQFTAIERQEARIIKNK